MLLAAALPLLLASAHASESTWRKAVDALGHEALEAQKRSDCTLLKASDAQIQRLVERTAEVFLESGPYGVQGAGEGTGHLDSDKESDTDYNCTTAVEAIVSDKDGSALREIRYIPAWELTFFGRAHFYETLWRPNAIARKVLKDVTPCLEGSRNYDYKLDAKMWEQMVRGNLNSEPEGKTFLEALDGKFSRSCKKVKAFEESLRRDWTGEQGAELSCPKQALQDLVREIDRDTRRTLSSSPIFTPTPWVPVRNLVIPAQWNREGQVLFVAFIANKPHPAFSDNAYYVKHQGTLIYRSGAWILVHSSSSRMGEPKGMTEVPFKDYLEGMKSIVGINLLAPVGL